MKIDRATVTFDRMPEVVQGGKTLKFTTLDLPNGKKIEGALLKDGTIARLKRRDDGKFDVKLIAGEGRNLVGKQVRVQGGAVSRLRNTDGEKFDIPIKLLKGKTLRLTEAFAERITQGLKPLEPNLVIRSTPPPKKEEVQEDEIIIRDQQPPLKGRERAKSDSVPKQDPSSIVLGRQRAKSDSVPKQDDADPIVLQSKKVTVPNSQFEKVHEQIVQNPPPLPKLPSENPLSLTPEQLKSKPDSSGSPN
jgi:hypothetical protein